MSRPIDNRARNNIERWQTYTHQTPATEEQARPTEEQMASAGANLVKVGESLRDTFDPTRPVREIWNPPTSGDFSTLGMDKELKTLLTSQAGIGEVIDVVRLSVSMMKNQADAGVHGVAAGIKALQDS